MIRIAVVDNESTFVCKIRKQLSEFLKNKSVLFQIYSYTDPTLFLTDYNLNAFDLIYLDIDMPKINGIELASGIRKKSAETYIIFVSSYSHFVFETFQYAPYRFIRKEKIEQELLESICSYCCEVYEKKQYLKFQLADKTTSLECVTKMVYFYSMRHDLSFVMDSRKSKKLANRVYTMDNLENKMESYGFIRIHKSYLLNYRYIYQILESEVILIPFTDGKVEQLPLSAKRVAETKRKFQQLTRGEDTL